MSLFPNGMAGPAQPQSHLALNNSIQRTRAIINSANISEVYRWTLRLCNEGAAEDKIKESDI